MSIMSLFAVVTFQTVYILAMIRSRWNTFLLLVAEPIKLDPRMSILEPGGRINTSSDDDDSFDDEQSDLDSYVDHMVDVKNVSKAMSSNESSEDEYDSSTTESDSDSMTTNTTGAPIRLRQRSDSDSSLSSQVTAVTDKDLKEGVFAEETKRSHRRPAKVKKLKSGNYRDSLGSSSTTSTSESDYEDSSTVSGSSGSSGSSSSSGSLSRHRRKGQGRTPLRISESPLQKDDDSPIIQMEVTGQASSPVSSGASRESQGVGRQPPSANTPRSKGRVISFNAIPASSLSTASDSQSEFTNPMLERVETPMSASTKHSRPASVAATFTSEISHGSIEEDDSSTHAEAKPAFGNNGRRNRRGSLVGTNPVGPPAPVAKPGKGKKGNGRAVPPWLSRSRLRLKSPWKDGPGEGTNLSEEDDL